MTADDNPMSAIEYRLKELEQRIDAKKREVAWLQAEFDRLCDLAVRLEADLA